LFYNNQGVNAEYFDKKRREFFLFNNISIPLRKIQWRLKFDFLEKVLLEALCFVL